VVTFDAIAAFSIDPVVAERPRGRTTRPFWSWLDPPP